MRVTDREEVQSKNFYELVWICTKFIEWSYMCIYEEKSESGGFGRHGPAIKHFNYDDDNVHSEKIAT